MHESLAQLCNVDGCRLLAGHRGMHMRRPVCPWNFMNEKDKKKINKTGYATPRGGAKGAYQNHVYRNNQVIIPYEKFNTVDLANFEDGYVVRLLPNQYFSTSGVRREGLQPNIIVGENAFVLYRTHESLIEFPPSADWKVRGLEKDGEPVKRRGRNVEDVGHYVLRISTLGVQEKITEGSPQGIFAPEYANAETTYIAQCALAWLTLHTIDSPYTTSQASHLKAILEAEGVLDDDFWERQGILRHGLCTCPLCGQLINYSDLHGILNLEEELALENASEQIEGSTRSTIVNLFHMAPLRYGTSEHVPTKVAWGHATCNTRLGQRKCYPLHELQETGDKIGIVRPEGINTFGWISGDWEMIRSPQGSVWIRICGDLPTEQVDAMNFDGNEEEDANA